MRMSHAAVGLLIGALLGTISVGAQEISNQKEKEEVVAVIDGVTVTQSDLEQKEAAKLLRARDQYYLAQRDALNQLVDDMLLEAQARREGVTVDKLLDLHVNSTVKDPTEDQLQVYYEGLQTDSPYSVARPKILETIRQRRTAKARAEYLATLHTAANVVVLLQPPAADVAIGKSPALGSADAPVQVIEFADYECPYCQKIDPDLKKLRDEFKGQLVFAFKDFPLPMHKHAEKAAEAARCAAHQGKFWEYHDVLFEKNSGLEPTQLKEYARTLGLDSAKFDSCLDSGGEAAAIQQDVEEGNRLGLTGTPSLFINGHFFSGITSYTVLHDTVAQQISLRSTSARKAPLQ
jgi:protein-disulfide isomerase